MNRWPVVQTTIVAGLILCSCSGTVRPSQQSLGEVKIARVEKQDASGESLLGGGASSVEYDVAVSEGCVEAWRKAIKGDEAGAMKQLNELDKKYPGTVTIKFMMGQVKEHLGKKNEAVGFYRDAVQKSQFNSMYQFKLAESLRTTGDAKGAAQHYRILLQSDHAFAPAHLGLAKSLYSLDKNSAEARQHLQKALELDPKSTDALQFSRQVTGG